ERTAGGAARRARRPRHRHLRRRASAQAGHLERGRGAGGLHHRQRHLPRARPRGRAGGHAGRLFADLDRRRAGGADGRADHRRARGHVPPLGGRVRLPARGVRAPSRIPVRLDGAAGDPPLGAGRHRHDLRRVRRADVRLRARVGAVGGGGRHPAAGAGQHPLGEVGIDRAEPEHGRQGDRHRGAGLRGVPAGRRGRRRAGQPQRPGAHLVGGLRPGAGVGDVGVRRLGGPHLHGRRSEGPGTHHAAGHHRRGAGGGGHLPDDRRRLPVRDD
ncbi:MAG: Uncharacterized amino acid permease, GabP family, partial [uncultured Gemmatimonadetes bacterium]